MSVIKEVILHVGLPKTGTTSVQDTLYNKGNNKRLSQEGILYPKCWRANHGNPLCSAFIDKPEQFGPNQFPKLLSKEEIEKKNRTNLQKFEATLKNNDADKLVISGEAIQRLSGKNIKKMKNYLMGLVSDQAKFKVMIYTRHPVTWAVSMIQQRFKYGARYRTKLNNRKKAAATLFQNRISKFIEIFGKEAVHVYPFEKARTHNAGMVGHFLEELNVDKDVVKDLKQIRNNESMSLFTGEFLIYLNERVPLFKNGKQNEKRHQSDTQPLYRLRGDKFDIPLKEKKEVASIAEEDMAWLKENYHIDYLNEEIKDKAKYQRLDSSFEDIERLYPMLTKTIRDSLVKFMKGKLISDIPSYNKSQCRELIKRLKEQEENLAPIDRIENRFQDNLSINGVERGIMYRELALFMEGYDQIGSAELLMRKAGLYRPKGQFIRRKHEEYKKRIQQECKGNNRCDSLNENIPNKTLLGLSKKEQALSGIGIVGSAIGLFNLFRGIQSTNNQ